MKKFFYFNLILFFCINSYSVSLEGKVISVTDGANIRLLDYDNRFYVLKLYGVKSPDLTSVYGKVARNILAKLIDYKVIECEFLYKDNYQRLIVKAYFKKTYLNEFMIKNGLAMWDETEAPNAKKLEIAEDFAKKNKLGFWKDKNPEREFRNNFLYGGWDKP